MVVARATLPRAVSEDCGQVTVSRRAELIRRWWQIVRGGSYWHRPQATGHLFDPNRLAGYGIDLTGKVPYPGARDREGAPLARMPSGRLAVFPTTVFQLALGHWDLWVASAGNEPSHLEAFRRLCDWACAKQDSRGGWPIYPMLRLESASPYSALSQGQAVSCLVRASDAFGDTRFAAAAAAAFDCLVTAIPAGGTARRLPGGGMVLEEYPAEPPITVLNGWIFALLAVHEARLFGLPGAAEAYAASEPALAGSLRRFDAGIWSRYDTSGNLASPFYHRLHVAQLTVLERLQPERATYHYYRGRWGRQSASSPNTAFAVAWKAFQQLRHPPHRPLR